MDRRAFLKTTAGSSLLWFATPAFWTSTVMAQDDSLWDHIDVGVASGDPLPDSVLLWTRVPAWGRGGMSEGSLPVTVEVATDKSFSPQVVVFRSEVTTDATRDFTVKTRIDGLTPYTTYYYRFRTDQGYLSEVGRTRTAPTEWSSDRPVRFAVVSCQDYTAGYYTVYDSLAQDDLDFCVHLGDFIYETGKASWQKGQVRADLIGGGEAKNLTEYRKKYRLYLSDPHLRQARRLFPWIYMWDDHEVFNDYAGTVPENVERMLSSYQAYHEYMPVEPSLVTVAGNGLPQYSLYRHVSYGPLADLFATDGRQYRSAPACDRIYSTRSCDARWDEARSLYGTTQMQWLQESLAASRSSWRILLNEVMMMPFQLRSDGSPETKAIGEYMAGGAEDRSVYVSLDSWDGFPVERQNLVNTLRERQISNVIVCTGDIHNVYAGSVHAVPEDSASDPVLVEIVTASITSRGVMDHSPVDVSRLGPWYVRRQNPYMKFVDFVHHTYVRFELRPDFATVTYRAVDSVKNQRARCFDLKTMVIPSGRPEVFLNEA